MRDILDSGTKVEIKIRHDGQVIWVNVDGACVLRINKPERIDLIDERALMLHT